MLPMFFAPRESEDAEFHRRWTAPNPTPETLIAWKPAYEAARIFWDKVIADPRISPGYRLEAEKFRSHF